MSFPIMTENGWRYLPTKGVWKSDPTWLDEQGIGIESIAYQFHHVVEQFCLGNLRESDMWNLLSAKRATIHKSVS
jgi:hypothetical protein